MSQWKVLSAAVLAIGMASTVAMAASVSDDAYYFADFTGNAYNSANTLLFAVDGGSATVSGDAVQLATGGAGLTDADDVAILRITGFNVPAATEFVVEYDFTFTGRTGDRFVLGELYNENAGADSVFRAETADNIGNVVLRQIPAAGPDSAAFLGIAYFDTTYHATIHVHADDKVDFYLDGDFVLQFDKLNSALATTAFQLGDPFGGAAYGAVTIDNISIGNVVVPEPTSLALLGLGGMALVRRRRA